MYLVVYTCYNSLLFQQLITYGIIKSYTVPMDRYTFFMTLRKHQTYYDLRSKASILSLNEDS